MERLTTNFNGIIYYAKGKYPPTTLCDEMETREVRECMTKLAQYEDRQELCGYDIGEAVHNLAAEILRLKDALEIVNKEKDYWEREAKKYCAQIGEIRILAGQELCDE